MLKLSVSRNFYRLRMTSLTPTNVFTISCLSIEPNPPAPRSASVNLVLQQSLAKSLLHYSSTIRTIRRLFADYSHYSSTIRGLFVLFVDYRGLFALFVDYSHYSRTIRTIRRLFVQFVDYSHYSLLIKYKTTVTSKINILIL